MKSHRILLTALVALILSSCQRDNDEIFPKRKATSKMLIEYQTSVMDSSYSYSRYYMDNTANILYRTRDTVNNLGARSIYDANHILVKMIDDYPFLSPRDKDTTVITRPAANTFVFESTGGYLFTAVITDIGSGRKKIHMEFTGNRSLFGYSISDFYMRANGKMDSSVSRSYSPSNTLHSIESRRITYNAKGGATTIIYMWYPVATGEITLYTNTIARDNNDNSVLESYVKSRWGNDLEWINYTTRIFGLMKPNEIFRDGLMPDILMVTGGSVLSYTESVAVYRPDGTLLRSSPTMLNEYETKYYHNSRLKSIMSGYGIDQILMRNLKYYN